MTLDEMLDGAAAGGTITVADGWSQGRATYGGLVAGLLVSRAEALCADPARRLRSASIDFVGPLAPGAAEIAGDVLRAGRSVTQLGVRIEQDGEVRATMTAAFAAERPSSVGLDTDVLNPPPALPAPEDVARIPYLPGLMPEFFAHVDLRQATGADWFTGAAAPDFGGWMRFSEPPAALGARELIALTDAWPPSIVAMLPPTAPSSTLTWTFEPVAGPPPGERDDPAAFWQYEVRTAVVADGYAHATARVWDAAGRLRALSHQTSVYFT